MAQGKACKYLYALLPTVLGNLLFLLIRCACVNEPLWGHAAVVLGSNSAATEVSDWISIDFRSSSPGLFGIICIFPTKKLFSLSSDITWCNPLKNYVFSVYRCTEVEEWFFSVIMIVLCGIVSTRAESLQDRKPLMKACANTSGFQRRDHVPAIKHMRNQPF